MSSDVKRCLLSLSRGQTIDKGLCFHYLQELNKQYQYNTQKVEFQFEQCKKTGLLQSNFIQSENLKTERQQVENECNRWNGLVGHMRFSFQEISSNIKQMPNHTATQHEDEYEFSHKSIFF